MSCDAQLAFFLGGFHGEGDCLRKFWGNIWGLCSSGILWGLFFHMGNVWGNMRRGIVQGGCPDPHAGLHVTSAVVMMWVTLVNTHTHTQRERETAFKLLYDWIS